MNVKSILTIVGLSAIMVSGLATGTAAQAPLGSQGGSQLQKREKHPEIRKAIKALENAKLHMQNAAHDFGGHRKEALDACDAAIAQLRLALKYDKN